MKESKEQSNYKTTKPIDELKLLQEEKTIFASTLLSNNINSLP